jgi:single-strand DNA-binding protein
MINRVVLVCRITRDPEVRQTPSGISNCQFTVAVDRQYQSQNGERQADFINCVAWRNQADFIGNYIKKGYMIGVEGRIQTRSYQDQQGQTRYVTEVVADSVSNLQPRNTATNSNGSYDNNNQQQNYQQNAPKADNSFNEDISDDDLPF